MCKNDSRVRCFFFFKSLITMNMIKKSILNLKNKEYILQPLPVNNFVFCVYFFNIWLTNNTAIRYKSADACDINVNEI